MNAAIRNESWEPNKMILKSRNPYIHKCCGCVNLRAGGTFICFIWIGLSLYFSILAFQNKSPFYSYINSNALYLFGAINLLFFCVSMVILVFYFMKSQRFLRSASMYIWIAIAVMALDVAINTILFWVQKDEYIEWCVETKRAGLSSSTDNADYYNCALTWNYELRFAVMTAVMIIMLYIYFAISIYAYIAKLKEEMRLAYNNQFYSQEIPNMEVYGYGNMGMPAAYPTAPVVAEGAPVAKGRDIIV